MVVTPGTSTARRFDLAVVAGFVLVLVAPTLDELVRDAERRGPATEQRAPAEPPPAPTTLAAFELWPEAYERYYGDAFGLRDFMLATHSALQLFVFEAAPSSMFVVGEDGWIFFRDSRTVADFRGLIQLTPADLARWQQRLEARRDYLASQGRRYLFVVSPNKETIYPEHFPARFTRVGPSTCEQLVSYLAEHSNIEVLDLRPILTAAKAEDRPGDYLYTPDGTHWTPRGSFVALHALTERLARDFPDMAVATEAEVRTSETSSTDSLIPLMYLGRWLTQPSPRLRPVASEAAAEEGAKSGELSRRHVVYRRKARGAPKVLVFHDSFMPFIEQALASYVSELTLEWTYAFDAAVVARADADVVIDMPVERLLVRPAAFDFAPPEHDPTLGFEASDDVVGHWRWTSPGNDVRIDPGFEALPFETATASYVRLVLGAEPRDVVLPAALVGDGRDLRVRVRIDATHEGRFGLRYRCRGAFTADGTQSTRTLAAGPNTFYFDLDRADVEGELELRIAGEGTASLREVEVRRATVRGALDEQGAQGTRK